MSKGARGRRRRYDLGPDDRSVGVVWGNAAGEADRVVRALLTALATLEDIVEVSAESAMALSTLEGIAAELGEMGPAERRTFIDALDRTAAEEPDRANWIQGLPHMLGLIDRA